VVAGTSGFLAWCDVVTPGLPNCGGPSTKLHSQAAVAMREVVAVLGSFPALAGVDLEVRPGEVAVVRGPNGAGKTTLLRLCAGLVEVRSGEAVVLGRDLRSDRREIRSQVGYLGHSCGLYGDLTALENVRFSVRAAGRKKADVLGALDRVGIDRRLAETRAALLSAGQRRRVALATIVARQPRLWLLDEPHASLDGEARTVLDRVVREAAEEGAAVLVASHDQGVAERIGDLVVTMSGGRTVAVDPVDYWRAMPEVSVQLNAVAEGSVQLNEAADSSVELIEVGEGSVDRRAVADNSDTPDELAQKGNPREAIGVP